MVKKLNWGIWAHLVALSFIFPNRNLRGGMECIVVTKQESGQMVSPDVQDVLT